MDKHLAMQCFCRIVETGSFAAAARDLNCSRSVISKYLGFLENWTQSRLLARTTRRMQLTEAGERFYAYCRLVGAETEEMLGDINQHNQTVSGRLVVEAPVSLTLTALAQHLFAFQKQYPAVTLDVRMNDGMSDLVREGIDVALRARAELDDSSLVAMPLTPIERVLCAAPAYWRAHGKPKTPADLKQHNCLSYLLASDAYAWDFHGHGERHRVEIQGSLRSSNSLLLIEAMLQGMGVSLMPKMFVLPHLRSGRLVPALTDYQTDPRMLFAVYPSRAHLPRKVSLFIQFLKKHLASADGSVLAVDPSSPLPTRENS